MEYCIVLLKNNNRHKILKKFNTYPDCLMSYNEILNKNHNIIFKKNYNFIYNKNKIITNNVNYNLALVRSYIDTDKNYITIKNKKYTILVSSPYYIEETFYVFGFHPLKERFTVADIIEKIIKPLNNTICQVIVLRNKVILKDFEIKHIIFCKNDNDAIKLHDTLYYLCKLNNYDNLIFMGIAKKSISYNLYTELIEFTNWDIRKLCRGSTKH